jgi:hypothetical protein
MGARQTFNGPSSGRLLTNQDDLSLRPSHGGVNQGTIQPSIVRHWHDDSLPLRSLRLMDGDRIPELQVVKHCFEDGTTFTVIPLGPCQRVSKSDASVILEEAWFIENLYEPSY